MYQCGEMFPAHDDAFPAMRFADGRHNPYGVTVTKSNHVLAAAPPEYAASHTWSSASSEAARQHTPAAQPHKFHARRSEATSFHSKFLAGSCEFVAIPAGADDGTISSEDPTALAEALRQSQKLPQPLFVGQLRFEMTAGELRWLLRHLAGIHALKVEPRGPGCFVVVCRSEADADAALRLNRRVLFDYRGVWVARTDAAALAVESRVAMLDPQLSRRTRLPRDAMVVERQRGSLNPLRQVCFQSLIETVPVTFERCEAPLGGSSGSSLSGLTSSECE